MGGDEEDKVEAEADTPAPKADATPPEEVKQEDPPKVEAEDPKAE